MSGKMEWGGARPNSGPPRTRWKSVFHADVQAALAVMGAADAVAARTRQDEAEIALVERLILEERDRRLSEPASARLVVKEQAIMYPVKQAFRIVELTQPIEVRGEVCRFQVLRQPEDEDCEYVAVYTPTREEAETAVREFVDRR